MIDARGADAQLLSALSQALRAAFGRRALPVWIAVAVVAVVLGVVASVGGFRTIETEPASVPFDEEVRLSTYAVTVLDARFTDAVEDEFLEADPGETLLVVTLRLENLTDRPIRITDSADRLSSRLLNVDGQLLDLGGADPTSSATIWRADGSSGSPVLQPGVPAGITVSWPVPESDVSDGSVWLDVYEARPRHGQVILASDVITWERDGLAARIGLGGSQ